MRTFEFWRRHSGGVWAVELDDGVVVGCCGPLDASDVDERFLRTLDFTTREADWIESHRDQFELFDPSAPYPHEEGVQR